MAEDPKPQNEGRVVYRRLGARASRAGAVKEPRYDPALLPLVSGFAILLLLILVLGNSSVRRLESTSSEALNQGQSYASKNTILLELRVALTKLDNESRDRMAAQARREIRPPFDLRLDTARNDVAAILPNIDHLPLAEMPKWRKFRDDLADYVTLTRDNSRYVQEGFNKFHDVDRQLNDIVTDLAAEQTQLFQRADALQSSATRTIRWW